MSPPVTIQLLDPPEVVAAGETVPLRFSITCAPDQSVAVVLPASGVRHPSAELDADLMTDDVTLQPGDTASLTVGVRLAVPGDADWSQFRIQVNPITGQDQDRALVSLPPRSFRVTPSLDRSLELRLTRVCTYGDAAKVEVIARNGSAADLTNLELETGPASAIRMGPLKKCVPLLRPGDEVKFDLVVAGPEVEFTVGALIGGVRLEGVRRRVVPSHETRPDAPKAFVFLEPRALTTDRVVLTAEQGGAERQSANGVYPVRGGKSRYRLTIYPTDPRAISVRLYTAAGRVEVEDHPADVGRAWPFTITVVDSPLLTQLVRLDYDVELPGQTLRGELFLSIRPTAGKLWTIAATAGLTMTIRGLTNAGPILSSFFGDGEFESALERIPELLEKKWFELFQLLSIFVFRAALWLIDAIWRPIEEG